MSFDFSSNISRLYRNARSAVRTHGLSGFLSRLARELSLKQPLAFIRNRWQGPGTYARWMEKNEPDPEELENLKSLQASLAYRPLISIIMPTYNAPSAFLREAIESVLSQVYDQWQLCIADDDSTEEQTRSIIDEYRTNDPRIQSVFRSENGHISACSNSALALARGEFILPMDQDDRLSRDALFRFAEFLNSQPEADLVYSDEDQIDVDGVRVKPHFKPGWSPDSLLSRMYTSHATIYRRAIVEEMGGFREGFEGAQDHDMALRFSERTEHIHHIPRILYHWRIHEASTASGHGAKDYANAAGLQAVRDALARRGEPGEVRSLPLNPGRYEVRYELHTQGKISILIPTRDQAMLLSACLDSVFNSSLYRNFEVVQIDNGSREPETEKLFEYWLNREPERFRLLRHDRPFNFSEINNLGASNAQGDYLLFLNNDIEVISEDWLEVMLGQAQRPSIGAVGAKLLYPDGSIQHAGIVLGMGEQRTAGHCHKNMPGNTTGYFGNANTISNFSAVTAACLMCKRSDFESIGGFDETLGVAFNDVDLCLRLRESGRFNVYLPQVVLRHHESKSRGYETSPEKALRFRKEAENLRNRWGYLLDEDPFYNPNLDRQRGGYLIRRNAV